MNALLFLTLVSIILIASWLWYCTLHGIYLWTYLPLDKDNRMLRMGFGKNNGHWFFRIDLWFFGIRVT